MRRLVHGFLVGAGLLLALPAATLAQTGSIAGAAQDDTGAVLPGVTVEVSSPALIEKVRSAVTDGSGQYKIIQLPPGVYSVTFSLGGFNTVKRDNVELTSDFTATINGTMKVGAVEETITVTGQSPIVDTQGVTQRTVMTREVLDTVPTGRNIQAVGIMIPGASMSGGRGRSRVTRCRRFRRSSAIAASLPRLERQRADGRGASPEQPLRVGSVLRRLLE